MLSSHIGGINFTDQGNMRKTYKELMTPVRNEAIHISNKYKLQLQHLYFEWEMFIPTLEKEFPDILNEMLSHNSQQQLLNSSENRSIPHMDREKTNNFRRINNRTRTLMTPSPTIMHPSIANWPCHFSHRTPETASNCNGNGHFTNQTYHANHTRGHTHNNTPFRMTNTSQKQQGFYHRGSPRSDSSLYGTCPCEYHNHTLHNCNITANHLTTHHLHNPGAQFMREICCDTHEIQGKTREFHWFELYRSI